MLLSVMTIVHMAGQGKNVVLKGKVIDSMDGYPLIGVSVIAAGQGAYTDVDGNYQISIPDAKCEVTFTYVGYEDEVKVYTTKNASAFSKIVLSLEMLVGRLEIIPMLVLFTPSTWKRM